MKVARNRKVALTVVCVAALAAVSGAFVLYSAEAAEGHAAVAVIRGSQGNEGVQGTVTFKEEGDAIVIQAEIMGLKPGKHGFHIHMLGDISAPDGTSAGGHFNPGGHPHAAPDTDKRHVGDLGNLEADASGKATYKRVDKQVKLTGEHSVVGRAVVVHAGVDDLTTQPTGDAGGRIGLGVIGIAEVK